MTIKNALKEIIIAHGGTPDANTIPGLLHDLAVTENPLINLVVNACTDTDTLMGEEKASDLQEDVEIKGTKIFGFLKYVTGYNAYTTSPELNHGNYIALHAEVPDVNGVTISVTMSRTAELDSDGNVVARVEDKDTQTITFTASKEGYASVSKTFSLKNLVCEEVPENDEA